VDGTVYASGSLGIGVMNPIHKLQVAGTVYASGSLLQSDIRWKKNIVNLESPLAKVLKLNGVKYDWRVEEFPNMGFDNKKQIGFIAQDVEKIIPELITTGEDGYKSISYEKVNAYLVEAIKEQQKEIDSLKSLICLDHPTSSLCE